MAYSVPLRTGWGAPFSASEPTGYWSLFNKKKQRPMSPYVPYIASKNTWVDYPGGGLAPKPGTFTSHSELLTPPGGMGIDPAGYGADQGGAGVGLSGEGRWGSGLAKKGLDYEAMLAALEKHKSAGPQSLKSLGKPGGTGGGGFKLFPNSMVENMASSGPLNLEQQKEDWWKRYLRSIA